MTYTYDVKAQEKYFRTVFDRAVDLCVMLCRQYGLDPMKDIICHCEGHKLGIAANHADVMHWFPKHGESMDSFRKAVKDRLTGNYEEGEKEMVEKGKINVNGKEYEIERILKNGENFVKLRDLKQAGFDVGYDERRKMPSLGVKAEKVDMEINGEMKEVSRVLKFGENYVRLRDLGDIAAVTYDEGVVRIRSKM